MGECAISRSWTAGFQLFNLNLRTCCAPPKNRPTHRRAVRASASSHSNETVINSLTYTNTHLARGLHTFGGISITPELSFHACNALTLRLWAPTERDEGMRPINRLTVTKLACRGTTFNTCIKNLECNKKCNGVANALGVR